MPPTTRIEVTPGVWVTQKHADFIRHFHAYNDGKRAFEAAGYSMRGKKSTIDQAVHNLVHADATREALVYLKGQLNKKLDITAERVLAEVAAVAFSDLGEFFTDGWELKNKSELPAGLTKLLASIKIRTFTNDNGTTITRQITLLDKLSALDKLMKHLQLYQEQPSVLVGFDWAAEMEKRRSRAKS